MKKPTKPILTKASVMPAVSSAGLTAEDTEALTNALAALKPISSRLALLGARDGGLVETLERKIRQRLNPHDPAALVAEANNLVGLYLPTVVGFAEEMARREAESEQIAKQRAAAVEQHRQEIVAKLEAQRLRRDQILSEMKG